METYLIPLFSVLFIIAFYPVLMIYLCIVLHLGIFAWLLITLMFSPFLYASVKVQYDAYLRWKREHLEEQQPIDREKALNEFLKGAKKHE